MVDPLAVLQSVGRVARRLGRALTNTREPKWAWQDTIPVAGIDGSTAEAITHFLRQQAGDGSVALADLWLCTLQLAQVAHDRLLYDLAISRRNLHFWKERLRAGSHTLFMLLAIGPLGFVRSTLSAAKLLPPPEENATALISHRIAFLTFQSAAIAEALAEVNLAAGATVVTVPAGARAWREGRRLAAAPWQLGRLARARPRCCCPPGRLSAPPR
jgi:hypothetical protein